MWRHVISVGGLTLLSRIFGFIRDVMMAALLGAGPVADAFMVAFRLPNHFRTIFAEGAFNAAFLPRYTATLTAEGEKAAAQFAGMIFVLTLIAQAVILMIALFFTPTLVHLLAPGFSEDPAQVALTIELTRITFPYLAFIAVLTLIGGILNAHRRFAAVASAPILLNVCMIGALVIGACFPSVAHALAWGVVVSGAAQLLWVWMDLWRYGGRLKLVWPRYTPDVKAFAKAFFPATLGAAGMQIAMFADTIIASFLSSGSVSYLYYAERLYQLPLAIFGIAIGTVLLPSLAARFAAGDQHGARHKLNRAVEGTLFLTIPCMIAFLLSSQAIMEVLFGRGAFDKAAVIGSAQALEAYAIGLVAAVMLRVFTPGFHAKGDTATPVKALVLAMVVNVCLKIVLIGPFAHAGLALATAIGAWINIALLAFWLYRRGDFAPDSLFWKRFATILVGGAGMIAVMEIMGPLVVPLQSIVPQYPLLLPLAVQGGIAGLAYLLVVVSGWKFLAR